MKQVRVAKATDAEMISSVILETSMLCCFNEDEPCPEWYKESIQETKIRAHIESNENDWLVATDENEIIGVLSVSQNIYVKYFFVLPKYQGVGIGKLLWNEAIRKTIIGSEVSVRSSICAIPVYEKLGFVKTEKAAKFKGMAYQSMAAKYV